MFLKDGQLLFTNKGGYINYVGHGRAHLFSFELAVPGVLLYVPEDVAALPETDRQEVVDEMHHWLDGLGLSPKAQVELVEDDENLLCQWKDCGRLRLKGRYICRYHYEQNGERFPRAIHYIPQPADSLLVKAR